jgi:4-hydroxybenzoate polyprenyltransferase
MRLFRAARVIHPFPTLLNVAATGGLAFVAARGMPDAWLLGRMLALMFCAQSAIGIVNDLCDRELDAATKPWKPIADGLVSQQVAITGAILLIAAVIGIGASLGAASLALAMLGLGSGLAYDLKLKRSALSAVPYMIAIPTLPLWVWATLGEWQPALWWLVPIGGLIGLALQLQNSLVDFEDDASQGVFGLAHRLGARRSIVVAWSSFGAALVASVALAPALEYDIVPYVVAGAVATLCFALTIAAYAVRRDAMALQMGFGLLGVGSAVLATGWLAAVT